MISDNDVTDNLAEPLNNPPGTSRQSTTASPYVTCLGKVSMKNLQSSNSLLRAYSGSPVNLFGTVLLKCKRGDDVENHLFYVVDNLLPPLLGLKTCLSMGLLKILCPVKPKAPSKRNSLLHKYSDVFKGIGCLAQPYTILTNNKVTPVQCPPRQIPFALTDKVKAELDFMVVQHIIEPVNEHSNWVNSTVITSKKNGDARICLDPRPVNKVKCQYHPMPLFYDIIFNLAGTKYFTILNAKCGYWQVPSDSESSKLTTFSTIFSNYKFLQLSFGLNVSQDVFQKQTEEALK